MKKSQQQIVNLICELRDSRVSLTGDLALALAIVIHAHKLDDSGQWGCAYFRCPDCGEARDCEGDEDWRDDPYVARCHGRIGEEPCEGDLGTEDLVISEGWVERLKAVVIKARDGGEE